MNVLVENQHLQDIANAIRAKNGTQNTYKPGEMADAIEAIGEGGITPSGVIRITYNDTFDITDYASAEVEVPTSGIVPTGTIEIAENGTRIDVSQYAYADVDVSGGITPTGTKEISITANGTTTEDVTNYASVEIDVDVPSGGITPTGTKTITENGTYDVTNFASAEVEVYPSGEIEIDENGTYDVLDYDTAVIDVPNSYTASDEGKVVSNGALVAQGSDTVTQNGTVDTTLINSLTVNVSGGGSGLTTIASGSFIGNNTESGRYVIDIGNKMAQTDFFVRVRAKQGEEFAYNSNYTWVYLNEIVYKSLGYYNLSTAGKKSFTPSSYYINSNNSGTITAKTPSNRTRTGVYIRNGGFGESLYNTFQIWRGETGHTPFAIYLGHSNQLYPFAEVEYEYEVVYFGSDPTNDIVDLS